MMLARIGRLVGTAAVIVVALGTASAARAQEIAGSFDQLRVLVKPGDRIRVTDEGGRETAGKLTELTPESVALLVKGNRVEFRESNVDVVRKRRQDSLANGALWGLGVGTVLGLALTGTFCEGECNAAIYTLVGLFYGGVGVGIGVGIDAMIVGDHVIYARRRALGASLRF